MPSKLRLDWKKNFGLFINEERTKFVWIVKNLYHICEAKVKINFNNESALRLLNVIWLWYGRRPVVWSFVWVLWFCLNVSLSKDQNHNLEVGLVYVYLLSLRKLASVV
ncbi:MAG: hypothetical protein ACTS6G_06120 [Candidatus Hodgkinia cicadicola]